MPKPILHGSSHLNSVRNIKKRPFIPNAGSPKKASYSILTMNGVGYPKKKTLPTVMSAFVNECGKSSESQRVSHISDEFIHQTKKRKLRLTTITPPEADQNSNLFSQFKNEREDNGKYISAESREDVALAAPRRNAELSEDELQSDFSDDEDSRIREDSVAIVPGNSGASVTNVFACPPSACEKFQLPSPQKQIQPQYEVKDGNLLGHQDKKITLGEKSMNNTERCVQKNKLGVVPKIFVQNSSNITNHMVSISRAKPPSSPTSKQDGPKKQLNEEVMLPTAAKELEKEHGAINSASETKKRSIVTKNKQRKLVQTYLFCKPSVGGENMLHDPQAGTTVSRGELKTEDETITLKPMKNAKASNEITETAQGVKGVELQRHSSAESDEAVSKGKQRTIKSWFQPKK